MDEYKPNSDKAREAASEKKVEKVTSGKTQTHQKSEAQKLANSFIVDDLKNIARRILMEVLIPDLKKAISSTLKNGVDIALYGEVNPNQSGKKGVAEKVSYQGRYERESERNRNDYITNRKNDYDYDDVSFEFREDAEAVLDSMYDLIDHFGIVSIADFYELAGISTDNYTLNRYGWRNLSGSTVVNVRGEYRLKLPRPRPFNPIEMQDGK